MALGHVVSDNIFYIGCKKLYKTKGHNLNKLGKVALGDVQLCEYCFMLSLLKPM